jgi:O-antigen/teichoic acid export membrane protein
VGTDGQPGRGFRSELAILARGGTLTLAGSIASSLLGFALVVVIARGFHGARSAGVLFEVIALFTILANTAELGADTGLVRMVATYRATGRTRDVRPTIRVALWPVLALSSATAAAVYLFAPQLARVFIHEGSRLDAIRYLRVLAPFLPMASATTVLLSGARGFGTMVPYVAILNVGVPGLRPLLIPMVLAAGLGATAVALSWALPVSLGFACSLIAVYVLLRRAERRDPPGRGRRRSLGDLAWEFWRFSSARGLAGFFQILVIWLNVLLLGALATTREAGIFAAVNRFTGVGTFALQAVGIALAPQVASLLARNDKERAEAVFQTGTWWLMALGWPVYLTMAVFAPFLLKLFGHDYVEGQTALVILSVGMVFLVGTGNNKIVLLMGGGSAWNLGITAASLVIDVGLSLVLIPSLGMNGAAVALAGTLVFDNMTTTLVVWKRLGLRPFGSGYPVVMAGSLMCFGVLGLAVRSALGMSVSTFFGFAGVAGALYLALLWRFRQVLRLQVLRSSLRRRPIMAGAPVGGPGARTGKAG